MTSNKKPDVLPPTRAEHELRSIAYNMAARLEADFDRFIKQSSNVEHSKNALPAVEVVSHID